MIEELEELKRKFDEEQVDEKTEAALKETETQNERAEGQPVAEENKKSAEAEKEETAAMMYEDQAETKASEEHHAPEIESETEEKKGVEKAEGKPAVQTQYYVDRGTAKAKGDLPGWAKFLIIFAAVILGIVLLMSRCSKSIDKAFSSLSDSTSIEDLTLKDDATAIAFDHDYIGVLHIEGTIDEDGASKSYNHQYLLDSIDTMISDEHNKGIILFLDTPGGSVFASDELYFKIRKYQDETKQPVYASMQSMCASGGYYISAPCDKIVANRNCWTGSIGVTLGTMFDVSELLDTLGVKTVTITAGENKAMGSSYEPMTKEQKQILQDVVDEAYEQFVGIVAEGRDMKVNDVKKLADGRIITAYQAVDYGLVDEIGTFEECVDMMIKENKLDEKIAVEDLYPKESVDIMSMLGIASELANTEGRAAITKSDIEELAALNGKVEISYISNISK